jgi:hypothetical protein
MIAEKSQDFDIKIRHIHAVKGADLADEWHIIENDDALGVVFSREWAARIVAGLKLLHDLASDMRKTVDEMTAEIVKEGEP